MPAVTEAHVVAVKNSDERTPNRYQVHLVVSGFSERVDARHWTETFMSCGSMVLFDNERKRPLYHLEVETNKGPTKKKKKEALHVPTSA